jgi:uncharacterized membrane protein
MISDKTCKPDAMRTPPTPIQLLLFVFILILLFTLVQIGLLHIAAEKLGIDFRVVLFALFLSLLGSVINLPLFTLPLPPDSTPPPYTGWLLGSNQPRPDRVIVAINLGGAILPILFSLHLLTRFEFGAMPVLFSIAVVSTISYLLSRPIPGLGIAMPVFIPPMAAALCALILAPAHSAPLAYISGTFGVILGADILRLKEVQRIGASVVSIGGAGTFDGIFLTGIVAVLLA